MNKLDQIQKWIGTMSYYNAAESPSWGQEASARKRFKDDIAETVKAWGVTENEFNDM